MDSLQVIQPKQIGPYIFHGTVGDGAFSVVKLVKKIDTGEYFACKIVPKARLNTINLEERFEIEIRINQQMHHPGIVELFDLLKDDLNYYIIMEFCPNGELFQFIVDRQHLKEQEAKPMLKQILETLNYVHSVGVSHRDLKPENLLIDQFGKVRLSDFGLSRFIGNNGLVTTPCGSPCYASPECISGKPYDGKTTDVWSIGVILYAMLTGQLPWTKRNQTQLFQQIRKGEYSIPSGLSSVAQDMIRGLMNVDFNKRLTIDQALAHPFLDGVSPQYTYTHPLSYRISIRKVDDLFDRNEPKLEINSDLRSTSDAAFSINQTLRILGKKGLPSIKSKKSLVVTKEMSPTPSTKLLPSVSKKTTLGDTRISKNGSSNKVPHFVPGSRVGGGVSGLRTSVARPVTMKKIVTK